MSRQPDDLAMLVEKEQIRELTARYAWFATQGDAASIIDLFAPDGSFEVVGESPAAGHDGLRAFYQIGPGLVHPMLGNHLIELDGDRATATTDMRNMIRHADGTFTHLAGYYEDSYVRLGGAWKFQSRRWHTRAGSTAMG